jgi:hypothetical protein
MASDREFEPAVWDKAIEHIGDVPGVFAENEGAVRLSEALGYLERARRPVVGHDKLRYGGDYLLMTRVLQGCAVSDRPLKYEA